MKKIKQDSIRSRTNTATSNYIRGILYPLGTIEFSLEANGEIMGIK